ncbi:hypothetical protein [Spirosoma flavum]|uniref:Uncharacterized protein n=1 Tax=Spirosoma flavum TaxID=2048557 RepID=A0ABW6AEH5_9BACT
MIKDPTGNIYKVKFISFTSNDSGTRGYPTLKHKLIKQD